MSIEDIIKSHLFFNFGTASNGWHRIYCEVCGDGKRVKGPRGGWLFQDKLAFYHCFNCGIDGSFDPDREHCFSKNMKSILEKFSIPIDECRKLCISSLKSTSKEVKPSKDEIKFIELPDHILPISKFSTDVIRNANTFLQSNYGLSVDSYPFHMSTGITNNENILEKSSVKFWLNRIIIPFYKNGKLIYYKGRDITGNSKIKYLAPEIKKTNIIFNYDQIFTPTELPLFVVESEFDAINLNGCAVMQNKLSKGQIKTLNKSNRKKIIVPDFGGDYNTLAEQAISEGWSVAIPKFGDCKDVSESIVKFGKLYTLRSIMRNVYEGKFAKIALSTIKS